MELFVFPIENNDIAALFGRIADETGAIFFDSADQNHPSSHYSYALYDPASADFEMAPRTLPNHAPVPFCGGLAGLVSYEGEKHFGLYHKLIAADHRADKCWFLCWAEDEDEAEATFHDLINRPDIQRHEQSYNLDWRSNFTRTEFENAVEKVRDYIAAGDIFQANIAQRFRASAPQNFDPFGYYLQLRRHNAAPFAAYYNAGEMQLMSASPERFISCKASGRVMTQPIKGTAPRFDTPVQDKASAAALEASEKDRAENIMIVDLLRNDISQVCEAESVDVTQLCKLESFARVHHLVSTIEGKLSAGQTPLDLLEACFPGGSITGAPKIRAMEIIREIEAIPRSAYCGTLVMIGFDGFMDSNILIRTVTHESEELSFQAGGGITYASDPAAEYEETLDKAAAIFESFKPLKKDRAA